MPKTQTPLGELIAAVVGAGITSAVQVLFFLRTGARLEWQPIALAAITGAMLGWGYRLAVGLKKTSDEALTRLEAATNVLKFQEEPLQMLVTVRKHAETLGLLLSDSMKEKYRYISYVDEIRYLKYLISAIAESKKYEGVQRYPVRWFRRNDRGTTEVYLRTLRDQPMKEKLRIFVIDKTDEQAMEEDLLNEELMRFYWSSTGSDVRSYWITTEELQRAFQPVLEVPSDFALYDEELLIKYDVAVQTLFFDVIQQGSPCREIFRRLAEQERNRLKSPFIRIEPKPAAKKLQQPSRV